MDSSSPSVYFLGAGATRADFPSVPLGDDLLHAVLCAGSVDPVLVSFLTDVFAQESLDPEGARDVRPRLDDVFTLIDAYVAGRAPSPAGYSPERLHEVRHRLIASIGITLGTALGDGHGQSARRFAEALSRRPSIVISTNYDIVMDNALFTRDSVNYGLAIRHQLYKGGVRPGQVVRSYESHTSSLIPDHTIPHDRIPLLKLHGSLNWLYCPRCDELDVTLQKKGAVTILADPGAGRCTMSSCTSRYETILVGPSLEQRYENRVLKETWAYAEQALQDAHTLVIIGYSLPEADYLIRAMLARHFSRRSEKMHVVDIRADKTRDQELEKRYRRLFPRCEITWGGFTGVLDSMDKDAR